MLNCIYINSPHDSVICLVTILTWNIKSTKTQIPPGDLERGHFFSERDQIWTFRIIAFLSDFCLVFSNLNWDHKSGWISVPLRKELLNANSRQYRYQVTRSLMILKEVSVAVKKMKKLIDYNRVYFNEK